MAKIQINPNYCKACKLCITACKNGVLKIGNESNSMGYHPVINDESKECTGCRMCTVICPEGAIELFK